MDGEDRSRTQFFRCQQCRHETALPVVAVHDVRAPLEAGAPLRHGHGGAREQRKARGVVVPRVAVDIHIRVAGAVVGRRKIDEPQLHARARQRAFAQHDRRGDAGNIEARHGLEPAGACHGVVIGRQQQPHVHAERRQRRRQAAADIAQPAGLDERVRLAGNEEDFHKPSFKRGTATGK